LVQRCKSRAKKKQAGKKEQTEGGDNHKKDRTSPQGRESGLGKEKGQAQKGGKTVKPIFQAPCRGGNHCQDTLTDSVCDWKTRNPGLKITNINLTIGVFKQKRPPWLSPHLVQDEHPHGMEGSLFPRRRASQGRVGGGHRSTAGKGRGRRAKFLVEQKACPPTGWDHGTIPRGNLRSQKNKLLISEKYNMIQRGKHQVKLNKHQKNVKSGVGGRRAAC